MGLLKKEMRVLLKGGQRTNVEGGEIQILLRVRLLRRQHLSHSSKAEVGYSNAPDSEVNWKSTGGQPEICWQC